MIATLSLTKSVCGMPVFSSLKSTLSFMAIDCKKIKRVLSILMLSFVGVVAAVATEAVAAEQTAKNIVVSEKTSADTRAPVKIRVHQENRGEVESSQTDILPTVSTTYPVSTEQASEAPKESTPQKPKLEIALNDDADTIESNSDKIAQSTATAEVNSESDTDIIAPNVDLKEVAPVPEVLPKAPEAVAADKSQSDSTSTTTPAETPTETPSEVSAPEATRSNTVLESGVESKTIERKPKVSSANSEEGTGKGGNTNTGNKLENKGGAEAEKKSGEPVNKIVPKTSISEDPKPVPGDTTGKAADALKTIDSSIATDKPAAPVKKPTASPKAEAAESAVKTSIKSVIESLKGEPEASVEEELPFSLLGAKVPPNTSTRLAWQPDVAITGLALPVPVLVINGKKPGETLCMTAAIHGDELNGIEVVRRVMYDIDPEKLSGQIIGIPIVNLQGFQRASRYLVDRRDLNRHFPGEKKGSLASRIAYSLFNDVIRNCSILVDLHTGSLRRTNLPQLRADMSDPQVAKFTEYFDEMVVVHGTGSAGMLRTAAQAIGIPAVTLEIGESLRLQEDQVNSGVKSINSLMDRRKMYSRLFSWGDPEPIYYKSSWIRAEQGGILFSDINLGDKVEKGQVLGVVTDPITNAESKIKAPYAGRVIGMAVNQVVMPGFAAYHLGAEATERDVSEAAVQAVQQEASLDNEFEDLNPEEADPMESDPLE